MVCSSSLLSLREDSEAPKGGLFTLLLPTAHSCLFYYGASILFCVDCRLAGIPAGRYLPSLRNRIVRFLVNPPSQDRAPSLLCSCSCQWLSTWLVPHSSEDPNTRTNRSPDPPLAAARAATTCVLGQ